MNHRDAASVACNLAAPAASETILRQTLPIICFSHLRWDFVFQRPQHLMTRAARDRQVFYWEEPLLVEHRDAEIEFSLDVRPLPSGVIVMTPLLSHELDQKSAVRAQRTMLNNMLEKYGIKAALFWYYTAQALSFSCDAPCSAIAYDCMDELSAFLGADPSLPALERDLLERATVVFTGGFSLYEAKRQQHRNVHLFPSGVDAAHFHPARQVLPEPSDQRAIPHPRLGFYGVIDERFDVSLVAMLAALRPDWHIILIGPIAKVDPATLPCAANIHYLGGKLYNELPAYLSGWDVALMPFALNDATRFISPTKTPEYLAAGRPVVSTPIVDVERQYGHLRGVWISATAASFEAAIKEALDLAGEPESWRNEADALLVAVGWDSIWNRMDAMIAQALDPELLMPELAVRSR
jgi:UDP-galactopyranose mutase